VIASLSLEVARGGAPTLRPPSGRIVLAQGETGTIDCVLTRSDTGAAVNLTGGAVQFAMSKRAGGAVVLSRALTVVSAVLGTLTLSFAYGDTIGLATGDYVCDIWYTDADGNRYPVLGLSTLSITAAVVTPGLPVSVLPEQEPLAQGPSGTDGEDGTVLPTPTADDVGKALIVLDDSPVTYGYGDVTPEADPIPCLTYLTHTSGYDAANATANVYGAVWKVPSGVTRIRVRMAMRDTLMFSLVAGQYGNLADVTGQKLAVGTPNVGLTDFASAPTQITGITYPAVGEHYVSGWLDVTPNAAGYIMLAWTMPATALYRQYGTWQGFERASSADVSTLAGASATANLAGQIDIDFETTQIPVTFLHDSLFQGVSTVQGECGYDASFGRDLTGYAICKNGVSSSKMSDWYIYDRTYLRDGWTSSNRLQGHNVIIALGFNDIQNSASSGLCKVYMLNMMTQAFAAGAKRVIPCTISASSIFSGAMNIQRRWYNAWVRGLPDFWDVDRIINPSDLDAVPNACADNVHWLAVNHRLLEASFPALGLE
jgi:hypothetical protein